MELITDDQLEMVRRACVKFRVARLELFGSTAAGEAVPERSDIDLLVTFLPGPAQGLDDRYFQLSTILELIFCRRVDLVVSEAVRNPYFRKSVDASKVLVYAAA